MNGGYVREIEEWQDAPVSSVEVRLRALVAAYAELCDQFCKDPMKNEAYRAAVGGVANDTKP